MRFSCSTSKSRTGVPPAPRMLKRSSPGRPRSKVVLLEGEREAIVRDGETADRRGSSRTGVVAPGVGLRALLAAAVGPDGGAREGSHAEHQRERHREPRKLHSDVHR